MVIKRKEINASAATAAQQQNEIIRLRKEIVDLKSEYQAYSCLLTSDELISKSIDILNRMISIFQSAVELKLFICGANPEVRKLLMDIYAEKFVNINSISQKMKIVENLKLPQDDEIPKIVKSEIKQKEKRIDCLIKQFNGSVDEREKDKILLKIVDNAHLLALLKGFISDPTIGGDVIYELHDKIKTAMMDEEDKTKIISAAQKVVRYKVAASQEEWANNLKVGLLKVSRRFEVLEERLDKITYELNNMEAVIKQAIEKLANSGQMYDVRKPLEERRMQLLRMEEEIRNKRRELASLIMDIVKEKEETKICSFSGMKKKKLKELATFWEAYTEHPDAAWKLAQIYYELKDWQNAKKWISEEVNRSYGEYGTDNLTDTLEFALKIARESGDKEWEKEIANRLNAHISVKQASVFFRKRIND